ncbi:hypothetical protein QBC36DRAFT_293638 [Triangularia setosa]|uniref:Uncharacterized protein n=1 Tax=Triangularia setosa TaxID=2587417 RepID=A0AAN6W1H1_9PEZI|nr:hypothetical protein QBC36DRAFT_293638 [Podospora setosa]
MADQKPPVAFIGLGAMGFGMAAHLIKQGYSVTGFDVWAPTLKRFEEAGGLTATTPADAVVDKQHVVVMVATAQQAQSVLLDGPNAAVPQLPQGAVVLLCSTVPCDYVQALQAQLHRIGRSDILLVDSPVSGGAARAADGTLSIMAGMSAAALEKGRPLLAELSDPAKLYIVDGGIGAGSNMKMVHQVLAANQILGASEVMGFADRLGLELAKAQKAVLESDAWNFMFEHRTPRIFTEFQPVASAVQIIVKDTSIITSEGRRSLFATPMTSTAEQIYFTGVGRGWAMDDDSSLVRLYTEGNGTVGPVHGTAESEEEKTALVLGLMRGILLCAAAESLAFAHAVNLDLDQVLDLCVNAAGGSKVLEKLGPAIIKEIRGGAGDASGGETSLGEIFSGLRAAVEEAQRIKTPLYLGTQALNILQRVTQSKGTGSAGVVVKAWTDTSEAAKCHWCQIRSFKTHRKLPITIVNETGDKEVLNPDFKFINHSVPHLDIPIADASFRTGCNCQGDEDCMYSGCECLDEMAPDSDEEMDDPSIPSRGRKKQKFQYYYSGTKAGLLKSRILDSREPIYECHEGCSCSKYCPNRVVERGRTVPLQIFRTGNRGWGVKCPVGIKKGQFVDRYLGEIITSEEANRRRAESTISDKKDVYLFALDKFSDPQSPDPLLRMQPLEVDGEWMSGPTRFINHSCGPNMRIFARVGDPVDKHIHDLALFAIRDIPAGEELTFDYVDGGLAEEDAGGMIPDDKKKEMTRCLCGTKNCRGFLW